MGVGVWPLTAGAWSARRHADREGKLSLPRVRVQPTETRRRCWCEGLARSRRWSPLGCRWAQLTLTAGRRWVVPAAGCSSKQGCVRQSWRCDAWSAWWEGEEIRLSTHQEVKKQQELEDASFSQPGGEEATAVEDAPTAASCHGCSRGLLRSSSPRRCQGPTNRRRRRDAVTGAPLATVSSSTSHGRWELFHRIFKRDARVRDTKRTCER
jgi:hypothetical protein